MNVNRVKEEGERSVWEYQRGEKDLRMGWSAFIDFWSPYQFDRELD